MTDNEYDFSVFSGAFTQMRMVDGNIFPEVAEVRLSEDWAG
jgi:hypothetical protein